ncbi:malonyl CoA-ACP transacylase [Actinomadura barringtoniae]|uniref:Malonyl CoA-ACP transacylase n=1 Tax=Actinomadura barringtoniae TaxID=1427535 RepID=A0A939TAN9_9ACTN|nr:malonyl CoA-ACP transacylase [Actinomadura barringtoniae]MBO2452662.1 malonyl CoA-ACP transacylase [Actinomadura barringtoniae]
MNAAAYVGERAILEEEVEARVAALRTGPLAARLPRSETADGRNLRRWVVQVMTHEAVIEAEAAALGLRVDGGGAGETLTLPAAMRMGGVAAAVLARSPLAREVRRHVTAGVEVPDEEIRAYFERNPDRAGTPGEAQRLRREAADRAFALWLARRHAALVRLMPGFEHPADPRHADAAHRH